MIRLRASLSSPSLLVMAMLLSALVAQPSRAGDEITQKAVDRAHDFLKTTSRGKEILGIMHFGCSYKSHALYSDKVLSVKDSTGRVVKGHFALVYEFKWNDTDWTRVAFLCDSEGRVYKVQTTDSSAIIAQPFFMADLSIKIVGEVIIEALKRDLNEDDLKQLRKIVDNADSKSLLEFSLRFQSALSK